MIPRYRLTSTQQILSLYFLSTFTYTITIVYIYILARYVHTISRVTTPRVTSESSEAEHALHVH